MSSLRSLSEPTPDSEFGGKAAQLAYALRARLPVPGGFALSVGFVERIVQADAEAKRALAAAFSALAGPVAARSSAIGEDGASASFAGQHATVLNVQSFAALVDAIGAIHASAHAASALAYRQRLGITTEPRMAVVVQKLVHAECAGVLFNKNPLSGADERVIEAAWGLGEAVVAGLVTPDRYRILRGGEVIERSAGDKDLAVMWAEAGGTHEVSIAPERAEALCLDDARLAALDALASQCESVFDGTQDLEWAFAEGALYLLQRRAITRG